MGAASGQGSHASLGGCVTKSADETADTRAGLETGLLDSDSAVPTDSDSDGSPDTAPDTGSPLAGCGLETVLGIEFATICAGTFQMGCTAGESDCDEDEQSHSVTLTHDFQVGVTEVTQAQFEAITGYNPSRNTDCGGDCPVETVTWDEAAAYATLLSREAGRMECYFCTGADEDPRCSSRVDPYACSGYRLLTEAEWEGAARSGEDTLYAGSDAISEVGWTSADATAVHAGAALAANACGTYDMSGNVLEWTGDWYRDYPDAAVVDPAKIADGDFRVFRGGSWDRSAPFARVASRDLGDPEVRLSTVGFRIGRSEP